MLRIIIDTREQRPWSFPPEAASCRRGTLAVGDYSLDGDHGFAIERKSLNDFLGTISSGWERFLREIGRAKRLAVIVEGDFRECCHEDDGPPTHNHPMISPVFAAKRIAELTLMGVPVLFAGSRSLGVAIAVSILRQRQREIKEATG